MGWKESPPTFTQATETIVDLANYYSKTRWTPPVHPLEQQAMSPQPLPPDDRPVYTEHRPATSRLNDQPDVAWPRGAYEGVAPRTAPTNAPTAPLTYFDVYVDDTIGLAQGDPDHLRRT